MNRLFFRAFSTTRLRLLKQINETVHGNVTTVALVDVPEKTGTVFLKSASEPGCSLCNCELPMKIKYSDVLVLEQFMREDGTVLPSELTGLCESHQTTLERCVMQAHWSGLFPDKTTADFQRSGYKRFNRWWKDDEEMFKPDLKKEEGTWYYIKRYNPKVDELRRPIVYHKTTFDGHGQWENPARAPRRKLPVAAADAPAIAAKATVGGKK